jgi:hypothetical protein
MPSDWSRPALITTYATTYIGHLRHDPRFKLDPSSLQPGELGNHSIDACLKKLNEVVVDSENILENE